MRIDVNSDNEIKIVIQDNDILEVGTSNEESINVGLDSDELIPIGLGNIDAAIAVTVNDSGSSSYPTYGGPYTVEPRKVQQELRTNNKLMTDDVTVNKIRYTETTNISGGTTVIIGYE